MIPDTDRLLEIEIEPLRICAFVKDHNMLKRLWRRMLSWEPCHLYKIIEILISRKD